MANKSPAFPFYAKDFLSDINVVLMGNDAVGAYVKLLAHDWIEDGLPTEDEALAKLSGAYDKWPDIKMAVLKCFKKVDGKFFNQRLLEEKKKQTKYRREKSAAGKKGAKSRWNKD